MPYQGEAARDEKEAGRPCALFVTTRREPVGPAIRRAGLTMVLAGPGEMPGDPDDLRRIRAVLADAGDPRVDAARVLAQVRGTAETAHAPVVVLDGPDPGTVAWAALVRAGIRHSVPAGADRACLTAALECAAHEQSRAAALHRNLAAAVQASELDLLTGLAGRRVVEHSLAPRRPGMQSRRVADQTGLMLIDVDLFKSVNDTHGHLAGDRVLVEVGRLLSAHMRVGDIAARWAGDEFAAILPGADLDTVSQVAERFVRSVACTPLRLPGGVRTSVSVSVGVAVGMPGPRLLAEADKAMYAAKKAGRGCVALSPASLPARPVKLFDGRRSDGRRASDRRAVGV